MKNKYHFSATFYQIDPQCRQYLKNLLNAGWTMPRIDTELPLFMKSIRTYQGILEANDNEEAEAKAKRYIKSHYQVIRILNLYCELA